MQHRDNARIELALHGRLILRGGPELPVVTRNISLRGACIECVSRAVRRGDRAVLVLQAEAEALLAITLSGRITYLRSGICGLTFDAVDVQDFADLYRLLTRSGPHPATIDSEIELGFVPDLRPWAQPESTRRI